jgi:hypothetical protein
MMGKSENRTSKPEGNPKTELAQKLFLANPEGIGNACREQKRLARSRTLARTSKPLGTKLAAV